MALPNQYRTPAQLPALPPRTPNRWPRRTVDGLVLAKKTAAQRVLTPAPAKAAAAKDWRTASGGYDLTPEDPGLRPDVPNRLPGDTEGRRQLAQQAARDALALGVAPAAYDLAPQDACPALEPKKGGGSRTGRIVDMPAHLMAAVPAAIPVATRAVSAAAARVATPAPAKAAAATARWTRPAHAPTATTPPQPPNLTPEKVQEVCKILDQVLHPDREDLEYLPEWLKKDGDRLLIELAHTISLQLNNIKIDPETTKRILIEEYPKRSRAA